MATDTYTYKNVPIEDLSRDELLEALRDSIVSGQRDRRFHRESHRLSVELLIASRGCARLDKADEEPR